MQKRVIESPPSSEKRLKQVEVELERAIAEQDRMQVELTKVSTNVASLREKLRQMEDARREEHQIRGRIEDAISETCCGVNAEEISHIFVEEKFTEKDMLSTLTAKTMQDMIPSLPFGVAFKIASAIAAAFN